MRLRATCLPARIARKLQGEASDCNNQTERDRKRQRERERENFYITLISCTLASWVARAEVGSAGSWQARPARERPQLPKAPLSGLGFRV